MAILLLVSTLLFQAAANHPGEQNCLGFIHETVLPEDVYVAATEEEGVTAYAGENALVHLNGKGVGSLKPGAIYRVVRAEGRVRHPATEQRIGTYYKDVGTVRIEGVGQEHAPATVLTACGPVMKGDIVVPLQESTTVSYSAGVSTKMTVIPADGLVTTIVLGRNGTRELAAGHICFIAAGRRDGVKPGEGFTVFRPQPLFNERDLFVDGKGRAMPYEKIQPSCGSMSEKLAARTVPPRVLGDLVILQTGETTSIARIVNSLSEIHPGDFVIRK